jgi:hypothetical protein
MEPGTGAAKGEKQSDKREIASSELVMSLTQSEHAKKDSD